MLSVLQSVIFSLVILTLVVVTVVVDLPSEGTDAVLGIFCAEAVIRCWAMGIRMYITDPMCIMDLIVTLLDLACTLASAGLQVSGGRLIRITRIFKLLKFLRMIRGFRCIRSCYRKMFVTKGPKHVPALGAMFQLLSKLDNNGDGRFHLDELQHALGTMQIVITSEFMRKLFNHIFNENQGVLAMIMDDIPTVLEEEDKTISLAEFEDYLHKKRASSSDERLSSIVRSCLRSWRWWAIFGNLVAKIIIIIGIKSLGSARVYDPADPDNRWVQAVHQSLNVIGCIGFNSLYYTSAAQRFDTFEHAEKTFVAVFKGVPEQGSLIGKSHGKRRDDGKQLDQVMNIDGVRALLENNRVFVSEAALAKLFHKIDTSGEREVVREK
jgi:hypothetical protein